MIRRFLQTAIALAVATVMLLAGMPQATAEDWWKPTADERLSLHWVLGGPLNINDPKQMGLRDFNGNPLPEPDVYDIDGEFNTKATVDYLHSKGKKVICYFDAGVYETYRGDADKFKAITPRIWGKADYGWDGSYWLDIRRVAELKPIMVARMKMCKAKGFDAIEPDEIDGWENETGFPLTHADQVRYNRALARWAHNLGMSIGQKGDIIQSKNLVNHFDWTLNEECFQYNECAKPWHPEFDRFVPGLDVYTAANKAVFVAEYKRYGAAAWDRVCRISTNHKWNTTRFKLGLPNGGGRMPCSTATSWGE